MQKLFYIVAYLALALTFVEPSRAQETVLFHFTDSFGRPDALRTLYLYPTQVNYTNGSGQIVSVDAYATNTGTAGAVGITNVLYGGYRSELRGNGFPPTTNYYNFPLTNSGAVVDAKDWLANITNQLPAGTSLFYNQIQSDARFVHQAGDTMSGGLTNVGLWALPGSGPVTSELLPYTGPNVPGFQFNLASSDVFDIQTNQLNAWAPFIFHAGVSGLVGDGSQITNQNVANFSAGHVTLSNQWVGKFVGDGSLITNQNAATFAAGNSSSSNLWNGTFAGTLQGPVANFTNQATTPVFGNLNVQGITAIWAKIQQGYPVTMLSLGDSIGLDVFSGLGRWFEGTCGVNGTGFRSSGPWDVEATDGTITNYNTAGLTSTNFWAGHFGLANGAHLYEGRYNYYDVDSSTVMGTNAPGDSVAFFWINRLNGGSGTLDISTNGSAFVTLANINSSAASSSLGRTNFYLGSSNVYTARFTGTGGGDGYFEVLGAELYVTNSPAIINFSVCASGHDWPDLASSSRVVWTNLLQQANPDLVVVESRHSAVPQSEIDCLKAAIPNAQIVVLGAYSAGTSGDQAFSFGISTNNWVTAWTNGLPYIDTWSSMHDTNKMFLWNWYAQTNTSGQDLVHLGRAGMRWEASLLLRANGLGDADFGVAQFDKNALGSRGGLFNTDGTGKRVAIGGHVWPYAQFDLVAPGGFNLLWDRLYANDNSAQNGAALYYQDGTHIPAAGSLLNWTNAFFTYSGNGLALNTPIGGMISFGLLNNYTFAAGSPNCQERGVIWPSGWVTIGSADWRILSGGHNTDLGMGYMDVQTAVRSPLFERTTNAVSAGAGTITMDLSKDRQLIATNANVTLKLTGIPSASDRFSRLLLTNSAASGTILVTCSGFNVLSNGIPLSSFYVTNNDAKAQVFTVDVDAYTGGLTNAEFKTFYHQ